jgi:DNA polymerase III alpha subunit
VQIDKYGTPHASSEEICDMLYADPLLDLSNIRVDDPEDFNNSIKALFVDLPKLEKYKTLEISVEDFDKQNQGNWLMPDEYKTLDIANWVLRECKTDEELQRVGKELLMFQDRDAFDILRFMKYLVDTFRKIGIVWGVGRGSSTASYVLYLIGVHRINSLFFDLPIEEFLK